MTAGVGIGGKTWLVALPRLGLRVASCGVVGGAFGAAFSLMTLQATRRIRRWHGLHPLQRTLAVAAACGLGVALIGIAAGGSTFGTARLISHEPLYHALSRVFIAEAIRRRRSETAAADGAGA